MKRKFLYILFLWFIGLCSCSKDFLNIIPETSITSASFYKTKVHFDQALLSAYSNIRGVCYDGMTRDEMRSDNAFFSFYQKDRSSFGREQICYYLDDEISAPSWANNYLGIAKLNTIIDRIDVSEMTTNEKNEILAVAFFLRAFFYFDLVQHWGPVPLMVHEVTDADGAFQPNSTIDDIYKQILSDVNRSIQIGLPVATTFPQSGRVTMGAAKMLQAYVYMTKPKREYALAEAALLDITKMNYTLKINYRDVFKLTNKNNEESIFECQYVEGAGGGNSYFAWDMIPTCINNQFLMGVQTAVIGKLGGWVVPTQKMIDSYESGDKRLDASIAVAEGQLSGEDFTVTAVKSSVGYTPTPGVTGYKYFVTKYWNPPYNLPGNTGDNFPIYRYSGALLLLAECLVEQNKANEALPYLNKVRARAGLNPLTLATKDNVANEMRHELAFENHRLTDLIRTGKAIEVLTNHAKDMKNLYGWLPEQAFNIQEYRLIHPILKKELDINKKLVQNPGY